MTEQYKCQSYYDDNILRDCTCGKCGSTDFREQALERLYDVANFYSRREFTLDGGDYEGVELALDAIVKLHEAEVERAVGEDFGSDMNDDELITSLQKIYQWGIGTGRQLESGKLKRVDEREWEMIGTRLDQFEQTFQNRLRREIRAAITPKENK